MIVTSANVARNVALSVKDSCRIYGGKYINQGQRVRNMVSGCAFVPPEGGGARSFSIW